jgi:hypothetical protein
VTSISNADSRRIVGLLLSASDGIDVPLSVRSSTGVILMSCNCVDPPISCGLKFDALPRSFGGAGADDFDCERLVISISRLKNSPGRVDANRTTFKKPFSEKSRAAAMVTANGTGRLEKLSQRAMECGRTWGNSHQPAVILQIVNPILTVTM